MFLDYIHTLLSCFQDIFGLLSLFITDKLTRYHDMQKARIILET